MGHDPAAFGAHALGGCDSGVKESFREVGLRSSLVQQGPVRIADAGKARNHGRHRSKISEVAAVLKLLKRGVRNTVETDHESSWDGPFEPLCGRGGAA